MHRREFLKTALVTATALAGARATALAQSAGNPGASYPDRLVTLVVPFSAGSMTDILARSVADKLSERWKKSVIVENRPGLAGTAGVAKAPADGYTLMLSESSSFAIWPSMHVAGTRYSPLEDFTWIAPVCTAPMVLIVSPDFPAKTLPEALGVLRSPRSEELSYSSSGAGSIPHIGAELLRSTLGESSKSRHIPYRGGAPAVLSVGKGETAWGVASLGSAAGLMAGGMVRPLAVTSPNRFPTFPDVPTFAEAGMPEMELNIYYLLHGPAGMPPAIVEKLNSACAAGLKQPALREKFQVAGMQAWEDVNTPEATRKIVEQELKRFKLVSDRTGIKISGG